MLPGMKLLDRILTIIITATLTSAAWIVFGGTWLEQATERPDAADLDGSATASDPGGFDEPATDDGAIEAPIPEGEPRQVAPARRALQIPVEGIEPASLTDSFLDRRGPEDQRVHEAIDIMAPTGTSVLAAAGGTIAKLHDSQAGGKAIYVRSPDRLMIHYYAHLDRYAAGLREGQVVRAGEPLGTVGSTGNAEPGAPHLHFAMIETTRDARWWEPGTAINPYPILTGQP